VDGGGLVDWRLGFVVGFLVGGGELGEWLVSCYRGWVCGYRLVAVEVLLFLSNAFTTRRLAGFGFCFCI
jgi:hypothetical protein